MRWGMFISIVVVLIALGFIMYWRIGVVWSDYATYVLGFVFGVLVEKYMRRKERRWDGFTR